MLDRIKARREYIYKLAHQHKAERLWVFGSCARIKDVFAPILGLVESSEKKVSPCAKFDGALPELDESAWNREIAAQRVIDAEMWK